MDEQKHSHNFFTGLILGAAIGAGLYYFLTSTKEGKKIKSRLEEKGKDVLNDLTGLVEEIEEKGQVFKQKAKEVQFQLEQKAKSMEGKVVDEVKEQLIHIKELRERGRQAAKSFTRNGKPLS